MPLVAVSFVRVADPGNPAGVPDGANYWHWTLPVAGIQYKATKPRRSERTEDAAWSTLLDIFDLFDVDQAMARNDTLNRLQDLRDEVLAFRDSLPVGERMDKTVALWQLVVDTLASFPLPPAWTDSSAAELANTIFNDPRWGSWE